MKSLFVALLLTLVLFCAVSGLSGAHDQKRPDLDLWYGNLKRPRVSPQQPYDMPSCCSKTDCHTTEAEFRGEDWWARVGVMRPNGDWDLRDWVKVPKEAVLQQHDNPTGEGVICHSVAWVNNKDGTQTLNTQWVAVWCFVPPTES